MGIIKGPLKLKGFRASQFMADQIMNAKSKCNIKLPFEATGFKSTKVPEGVDLSGIKFAKDKDKPKNIVSIRYERRLQAIMKECEKNKCQQYPFVQTLCFRHATNKK